MYTIFLMALYFGSIAALSRTNFTCDPYGTIYLKNPDPFTFTHAHAVDYKLLNNENYSVSNTQCKVTIVDDVSPKILVEPNDQGFCGMGRTILVTLSNTSLSNNLIASVPFKELFLARCIPIPSEGIKVNVTQDLHAMDTFDDVPVDYDIEDFSESPNFVGHVRSRIYPCCTFNEHTTQQTSAFVGTHLLWTLDVSNEYHLLPIICRAHAGQNSYGSPSTSLLIGGCSNDTKLVDYRNTIDNFPSIGNRERRVYVFNLYAFHFITSPYVTIICHLKVCRDEMSGNCAWDDCGNARRRRRSPQADALLDDSNSLETTLTTMHVIGDLTGGCTSAYIAFQGLTVLIYTVSILTARVFTSFFGI